MAVDDICTVTLSGNLTRDAELTYTNSGFAILKMGIAVNRSRKVGETWEQQGHFFDATILGKRGEGISPYLVKGTRVFISGKLEQQRWQDKESGQNRSKISIIVDDIIMASRNDAAPKQQAGPAPTRAPAPDFGFSDSTSPIDDGFGSDDIPF